MTTFEEGVEQEDDFNDSILQNAEKIKQDIIEKNRTLGGENGYDWESKSILKGDYNKPENNVWIRIHPNFETKSAKLTIVNNDSWSLDTDEIFCIVHVKDILRKWGIEEYCICNRSNQFLMYFQPLTK